MYKMFTYKNKVVDFLKSNIELSHYTYYRFHSDFHITDDTFRRIESVYENSDFHSQ